MHSEIPIRIGLNTYYGECIRIYRTCSEKEDFLQRMKQLFACFMNNKYSKELILAVLYKVLGRNPSIATKYGSENWQIAKYILN